MICSFEGTRVLSPLLMPRPSTAVTRLASSSFRGMPLVTSNSCKVLWSSQVDPLRLAKEPNEGVSLGRMRSCESLHVLPLDSAERSRACRQAQRLGTPAAYRESDLPRQQNIRQSEQVDRGSRCRGIFLIRQHPALLYVAHRRRSAACGQSNSQQESMWWSRQRATLATWDSQQEQAHLVVGRSSKR